MKDHVIPENRCRHGHLTAVDDVAKMLCKQLYH